MTLTEKIIDSVHKTTGLRCFEGEPKGDIFGRFAYFVTLQSSNRFGEVAIFFVERPVYNRLSPTRATEDCAQLAIRWLNGLYAYSGLKFQDIISQNSVRDGRGGYGIGIRLVLANTTSTNFGGKIDFVELALSCSPLGAAQLSGAKKYMKGKTATAGATAKHGFTFTKWTDGTSDVSTDNPYSFTINDDTSLVAVLSRNNYTLSLSGGTGVTSTTGGGTYPYEQSVTATAVLDSHYDFSNWTSGGTVVSSSNPYQFNLLADTTLQANATPKSYNVLGVSNDPTLGSVSGGGTYTYGSTVTLTATPVGSNVFENWTVNGTVVSSSNPYVLTATEAVIVQGNFAVPVQYYSVTTAVNDATMGSASGGGSYQSGATCTLTATPNSGYQFVEWQVNGSQVSTSDTYSFTVSADVTVTAVFEAAGEQPLTFTALESGSISWTGTYPNLEYSKNGGAWTALTESIPVTTNDTVKFRNNGTTWTGSDSNSHFTTTGTFNLSGKIMSLIDATMESVTLTNSCFKYLFKQTGIVSAEHLELPDTTASSCYANMFSGCTSLTTAPELPATTLNTYCYQSMFYGCTALVNTQAKLPATSMKDNCYNEMFRGCTSLTTAPELPATSLYQNCYSGMFYGCTALVNTQAKLPATSMKNGCYQSMFSGCTSLTTAPELPAVKPLNYSYSNMFQNCSSLNYIKCLATNITATGCTNNWVSGVAATGTFVKATSMSSWTTGTSGIPSDWTVQNA